MPEERPRVEMPSPVAQAFEAWGFSLWRGWRGRRGELGNRWPWWIGCRGWGNPHP